MLREFRFYLVAMVLLLACGGSQKADIKPAPMPAEGSFNGVYHSPQYGEMHLIQTGTAVEGWYKKDERSGRIHGSVDGDLMRFDWVEKRTMISNRPTETSGKGYFKYMIDPSNGEHVLKGKWGLGDSETGGGVWNAWKSLNSKPKMISQSEESGGREETGDEYSDEDYGENQKPESPSSYEETEDDFL